MWLTPHLHVADTAQVKTGNVLLDAALDAKLGDFGVATRFGLEHTCSTGTARYMAPEVVYL